MSNILTILSMQWFSILGCIFVLVFISYQLFYIPLISNSLRQIPGPKSFACSHWRLAYEDLKGTRTRKILALHRAYGSAVRVGSNEVSFNSLSALRTIYGAGSGFERHSFYRMFDAYGHQNLFTFGPSKAHGDRKKILKHAYSKSSILKGAMTQMVESKAQQYLNLLEEEPDTASEIFTSLHYFSLDSITDFLYGDEFGGTSALTGSQRDRALLDDIIDPARRKLSWFAVHFPRYTKWLYSRTGVLEKLTNPLLPMRKPSTYTGIRAHALEAFLKFKSASPEQRFKAEKNHIIGLLWKHHVSQKEGGLGDMDIASECADHLLAGIDTTSDTLMFLIWAISLPRNIPYQNNLIHELSQLGSDKLKNDIPSASASDKLPYLDAVIKETLRLYAPLPASEPRCLPVDCVIDGYTIPAGTVVSMSPFSLHRNADVFPDPLKFDPQRWLGKAEEVAEMKKWWWAFSSGGRMCIGMHLAMAEMTTLVAAIYSKYSTSIKPRFEDISPGITSRFEVFSDDAFEKMEEHKCWIKFQKR